MRRSGWTVAIAKVLNPASVVRREEIEISFDVHILILLVQTREVDRHWPSSRDIIFRTILDDVFQSLEVDRLIVFSKKSDRFTMYLCYETLIASDFGLSATFSFDVCLISRQTDLEPTKRPPLSPA